MSKINYIDSLNGKKLFAERAEYTKDGQNIDASFASIRNNVVPLIGSENVIIQNTASGCEISITGPCGPVGNKGPCGPSGNQGTVTGAKGPCGPSGAKGPCGPSGNQGANNQGNQGVTGAKGPCGPSGAKGPCGPQGNTGVTGAKGPCGPIGNKGPCGPSGNPGTATGPKGNTGVTGAKGPCGPVGDKGPCGPSGLKGITGAPGNQGVPGARGPCGPSGNQGVTGAKGPCGPRGNTGPCGPSGDGGIWPNLKVGTYSKTLTPSSSWQTLDQWKKGSDGGIAENYITTTASTAFYVDIKIANTTKSTNDVKSFTISINTPISDIWFLNPDCNYTISIQLTGGTAAPITLYQHYIMLR